jgi:ribonuclease BN (tRNA processing enzyme)
MGKNIISKIITDEENEVIEEVNSEEEKISPNSIIIFRTYYNECGHTKEEIEIPSEEIVNMSKNELQEIYGKWNIESFTKDTIILIKYEETYCGEHYILKNEKENIVVYSIDNDNQENLFLSTEIPVKYLPEQDQENIRAGLYVYGKKNLIELLQDFE